MKGWHWHRYTLLRRYYGVKAGQMFRVEMCIVCGKRRARRDT